MRTVFINSGIISPFRKFTGSVVVEGGKIDEVLPGENVKLLDTDIVIDAKGLYLSPGFIELHTHGGGGHDFMDGTEEAISEGCRLHMRHGVTAVLPTTLSSSEEELYRNLALIEKAAAGCENIPEILGVHLEGPYFSPEQNAAQDKRHIKLPKPEEYKQIYRNCQSIKIWSVAPELPGAMEMGRWLRSNGIIASIGHSNAVYEDIVKARENGYTMLTHFFNGMSRLIRKDAKMYLGVSESGLCFDDLVAEVIADGCHLPPCLLKLIYKVKGADGICLVTDSMRAAGQDVSTSILGSIANGQRVEIEDGVAYMPDRTSFGGSIATADRLVRTMYTMADVPLCDAVKMMTVTPARMLGIDNRLGKIVPGADADIILFDEGINIKLVMAKGKIWMCEL